MAVKVYNGYACGHCGKVYNDGAKADVCRESHELIYVPLTIKDLNLLLHFIHTKDDSLLSESLMATLNRYIRGN